jgi:hypothetical protein
MMLFLHSRKVCTGDDEETYGYRLQEEGRGIWYPADALKLNQGYERADLIAKSAFKQGAILAEPKLKLLRKKLEAQRAALEEESATIAKLAEDMQRRAGGRQEGSSRMKFASDFCTKRSQDVRARLEGNIFVALEDQEAARLTVLRMVSTLRVLDKVDWGEGLVHFRRFNYDDEVGHTTVLLLYSANMLILLVPGDCVHAITFARHTLLSSVQVCANCNANI